MIGVVDNRHEQFLLRGFDPCVNGITSSKSGFPEFVHNTIYPDPIVSIGQSPPGKAQIQIRQILF